VNHCDVRRDGTLASLHERVAEAVVRGARVQEQSRTLVADQELLGAAARATISDIRERQARAAEQRSETDT
jgi:uncharacterized NAD-dependent epimerase/dehydratase family protein